MIVMIDNDNVVFVLSIDIIIFSFPQACCHSLNVMLNFTTKFNLCQVLIQNYVINLIHLFVV